MIIIVDAGSTKTHWCLMAANGHCSEYYTDGINPFQQTLEAIKDSISTQLLPKMARELWAGSITNVYFYGAGCTPEKIPAVKSALESVFKRSLVEVYSDMIGAARSLFGCERGVACILGTGANSCLWNGKEIEKNVPALGFILGDEGSGAVLGKRLVADLLKNQLSDELKEKFLNQYGITAADIIENVYRKPFPNRYLASLSKFCAENMDNPLIAKLVYNHFDYFAKRILMQYPKLPIGFTGSIAYYYQDVLKKVLADNGLLLGKVMQSPMEGLKVYHRKDAVPTM
jgi:N-acetylglucosamine kinase-like BadF-type ATPase